MGGADSHQMGVMEPIEWSPMVGNAGQEALAGSAAASQAGSDATLAPSAAALAVSRAALAAIAAAQDDTAVVGSAAALAAAAIAPVAVNPLQITTVAARQPTLSPWLLLIVRLACPILAPSSTLGPSPFPLDLHLAMGPNI